MSNLWAETYEYAAAVTKSDTLADPKGPFAGLLVDTAGILKLTPLNGPDAGGSITLNVVAGEYVRFPVQRVWSGTTTAVVFGLVAAIINQGK